LPVKHRAVAKCNRNARERNKQDKKDNNKVSPPKPIVNSGGKHQVFNLYPYPVTVSS